MDLKRHIIDTIKEWQLKIGYREGNMKLYYPGESLEALLACNGSLEKALQAFCHEAEAQFGRINISGSYQRYCLDIPAKGCAYVAGKVPDPEFLKIFLDVIKKTGNTMEQVRECFGSYAEEHGTTYVEDTFEDSTEHGHSHKGNAFYFGDDAVEEYVYWVEENEFGLTYHRFFKADYEKIK